MHQIISKIVHCSSAYQCIFGRGDLAVSNILMCPEFCQIRADWALSSFPNSTGGRLKISSASGSCNYEKHFKIVHFGPLVAVDRIFSSLEVVCLSLIMHLFPLHCSCFVPALYWIALGARCTQYFHQGSVKRCAGGLVISDQVALRQPTTSAFISELLRNWNCNWTL